MTEQRQPRFWRTVSVMWSVTQRIALSCQFSFLCILKLIYCQESPNTVVIATHGFCTPTWRAPQQREDKKFPLQVVIACFTHGKSPADRNTSQPQDQPKQKLVQSRNKTACDNLRGEVLYCRNFCLCQEDLLKMAGCKHKQSAPDRVPTKLFP